MSRVGKNPITIPEKTEVKLVGRELSVKGPLGTIVRTVSPDVVIEVKDGSVLVSVRRDEAIPLWGTWASHIRNMIKGVNTLYEKKLIVEGIGFKSDVKPARPDDSGHSGGGKVLAMSLGFSHPVSVDIPEGLKVTAEKNQISVAGVDKELVGQFTAYVRAFKKPEPYKGKGIRYSDEVIRRKQGKKAA